MQFNVVAGSPFAVLSAIVAPAILTNASSVLALGTSNRLARVVDRTRIVAAQLAPLHVRAQLLVKALRLFYAGLGLFAASALVSVGGSRLSMATSLLFTVPPRLRYLPARLRSLDCALAAS